MTMEIDAHYSGQPMSALDPCDACKQKDEEISRLLDEVEGLRKDKERLRAMHGETPTVPYGCHCDLEPRMQPDKCVLDQGSIHDCILAENLVRDGKTKWDCREWQPIKMQETKR